MEGAHHRAWSPRRCLTVRDFRFSDKLCRQAQLPSPTWVGCFSFWSLAAASVSRRGAARLLPIHGITNLKVKNDPSFVDVAPELLSRLSGAVVVAHNATFAASRPSASRAASCSTVRARAQVPLRDQRRNCDHTRVQGPNDSGRNRHWQPVWETYSIASTTPRRSAACLGPRLPGALNTGSSSAPCWSVRSLGSDMERIVPTAPTSAVASKWDTPSWTGEEVKVRGRAEPPVRLAAPQVAGRTIRGHGGSSAWQAPSGELDPNLQGDQAARTGPPPQPGVRRRPADDARGRANRSDTPRP